MISRRVVNGHLDVEVGTGKLDPSLRTNSRLLLLLLLLCVDGMMNDPMEESLVVDKVAEGVAKLTQHRVPIYQRRRCRRSPARFLPAIGPVGGHDQRLVFDQTRQRLQYGLQNGPIALLREARSGENAVLFFLLLFFNLTHLLISSLTLSLT